MKIIATLLLLGASAFATTVSATYVVDPNGYYYTTGTVAAALVSSGRPTVGGAPINQSTGPFAISGTGGFAMTLTDTSTILPANSRWVITVCGITIAYPPDVKRTPVCFSTDPIAVTGTLQDVTATLVPLAKALGPAPPTTGNGGLSASTSVAAGDYTAQWLAAFAVVSGIGWDGAAWHSPTTTQRINCPTGSMSITQQLVYHGSPAFSFTLDGTANDLGSGSGCVITWNGVDGGCPILLDSATYVTIRNITLREGTGRMGCGINLDALNVTHPGAPGTQHITLDHVTWQMTGYPNAAAVLIGHAGCVSEQVSEILVRDSFAFADATTASTTFFKPLCGNNVKNFKVQDTTIYGFGTGLRTGNGGGFTAQSVLMLANGTDVVLAGGPQQVNLIDVRSESSARFMTGAAPNPSGVNIIGGYWVGVTPADDLVINAGGLIRMDGWYCETLRVAGAFCKFQVGSPRHDVNLSGDGFEVSSSTFKNAGNVFNGGGANWPFADTSANPLPGDPLLNYYAYYGVPLNFRITSSYGGSAPGWVPLTGYDLHAVNLLFTTMAQASSNTATPLVAQSGIQRFKLGATVCWAPTGGSNGTNDVCTSVVHGAPGGA